jgi:uncharacterized protein YcaQ
MSAAPAFPSTRLSAERARQLAVEGAYLSAPRPRSILDVVERLMGLQTDPTRIVARSEQLVLWSRLGQYEIEELERLRYAESRLFDYWAYIVPTADYALHRPTMRRNPRGNSARARYTRDWLAANADFQRYILRELRRRGPLRSRDLDDRAIVPWRTGGWNDGKNLSMMLERLWFQGKIAITGRTGQERIWDLAERVYPVGSRLTASEVARRLLDRRLRMRGVARVPEFTSTFDGQVPGAEHALRALVRDGVAVPVDVEGLAGPWYAHREALGAAFRPRTTLLSPFDQLISKRERTEDLFDFRFRLEIYVPKAKREYGYFVLPVLHGDRLVGRVDPRYDRRTNVLHINAVHWEDELIDIEEPVAALAGWFGAREIRWP